MSSIVKWFRNVFKKKKVTTANIGVTARMDDDDRVAMESRPHSAISLVARANRPADERPKSAPVRTAEKKYPPIRRRNSFGGQRQEMCPCCLRKRQLYKARGHFRPYVVWTDMKVSTKIRRKKQHHVFPKRKPLHQRYSVPQINQMDDLSKTYGPGRVRSPVHQELLGPYAQFPQYNVTMPNSREERDSLDSGIELMMIPEPSASSNNSMKRLKGRQSQESMNSGSMRLAWSNRIQGDSPYGMENLLEIHKNWPRITRKAVKQQQGKKKPPFRF